MADVMHPLTYANLQDLSHHLSRLLQVTTNGIRSASFTSTN